MLFSVLLLAATPAPAQAQGRDDLRPWERLEGEVFVGRKEVSFSSEQEAKSYILRTKIQVGIEKEAGEFVVRAPATVYLMRDLMGRTLDKNERLDHGILSTPTGSIFDTKEEATAFAGQDPDVEAIVEDSIVGRKVYVARKTTRQDLVILARKKLWQEGLGDRWLVRERIGDWPFSFVVGDEELPFQDTKGTKVRGYYSHFARRDIEVLVYLTQSGADLDHQFIGFALGNKAKPIRSKTGTVLEAVFPPGWSVYWKHRDGVFFVAGGQGDVPRDFIDSYVNRFGSAWDAAFEVDRLAWAKREVPRRFDRMRRCLAQDAPIENAPLPYNIEFAEICRWFDTPHSWNLAVSVSVPQREEHLKNLRSWWQANASSVELRRDAPLTLQGVYRLSRSRGD